jgi:hypothetical protein
MVCGDNDDNAATPGLPSHERHSDKVPTTSLLFSR